MPVSLTTRQVRMVEWLLDQTVARSMADAARELRMSPRVVRSGLDPVERFLASMDVRLHRQRGVGIWIDGEPSALSAVRAAVASDVQEAAVRVYSAQDRLHLVRFELLTAAPETLTVERLQTTLEVSVTSARRDLAKAEPWLSDQGLFLARRPGSGVSVVGTETAVRRALVKLLLEVVPAELLTGETVTEDWWHAPGIGQGNRQFLRQIPLYECHWMVQANETLRQHARSGHPWLAADLAVISARIAAGRTVSLEPGALRSLTDHPVWETAESIGAQIGELVGKAAGDSEIGGITEHLLGMARLAEPQDSSEATSNSIVRSAVALAAERLHPGLVDDWELESNLAAHFARLSVRLRYGLPVHNPLLVEVAERYPDVHDVALEIAALVSNEADAPISEDEAGFVTMYLSGAMERLRLKPRSRAIVVCPSGLATAWILVSRIQAEFPELELVEVVSAGSFEARDTVEADMIISTVPLVDGSTDIPVIVVNALLPAEDVRRLSGVL